MSNRPAPKPLLLYGLLACSLTLNVVMFFRGAPSEEPDGAAAIASPAVDDAVSNAAAPGAAADAVAQAAPVKAEDGDSASAEWTVLRGKVEHSMARTFQLEAGEAGDALASVFARVFVWDVDLRRDLKKGDAIAVAWRTASDGFPEIAAASLQSEKLGRKLTAYRWQSPGDAYPSFWHIDGTEAPLRLRDGPLSQYEQITSLLKDRPTHKGMDFKTPVGTEVSSPRAGTVTRANWNWNSNGNCIEIRYDDGVLAKFLHLSENRVAQGERVKAGQVIALTGNTGHSTAPHLHYQLDRGDKTVDPLDYHGTDRRSLDANQIAALKRDIAGFERMLGEAAGG